MDMVRRIVVTALTALALAQLTAVPAAWAQRKFPAPVIAVVDIQAIMQTAEAPKAIQAQAQKAQAGFEQGVKGKDDEFKKLDQDLQAQRSVLAPEAFQQRQREFDQKVADARREIQERRGKLKAAFDNAFQQVESAIIQIVDQMAKESGTTLVLPKGGAIYAQAELDITQEVVKRLNAKLPSVAVA